MFCRVISFLIFSFATHHLSHAAACCTSAAAFGVGRLMVGEKAAFGFNTSLINQIANFESQGEIATSLNHLEKLEFRQNMWTMVALSETTSAYLLVPWIHQWIPDEDIMKHGGGFSDIQIGARLQALSFGDLGDWPAVAFTVMAQMPTGIPKGEQANYEKVNVTGMGAWLVGGGVSLEKLWQPFFLQLNSSLSSPFPYQQSPILKMWLGMRSFTQLALGIQATNAIVLSGAVQFYYVSNWYENGEVIEDSAIYKTSGLLAVAWRILPQWTLQTSVTLDIPSSYMLRNTEATAAISVGVRYGF